MPWSCLLNLKSPSQDRQDSFQGWGMKGRSHVGMASVYIVALKVRNMSSRELQDVHAVPGFLVGLVFQAAEPSFKKDCGNT
ncbi:hypothetical protein chiPu_0020870 [Chiloscyllium punctatum]|uniref:Uncharacterized protein n=1 Tax=Chiloscyllium punctatum TaxID=137246 RepID=A0A401RKN9_CHIPU|nr:hypothetical protein [Chiloscyllium punctatum]